MAFTDDPNSGRVFSDADLKRLKENLSKQVFPEENIKALIARLESAEAERDALLRERELMRIRLEAAEKAIPHLMEHGAVMCNRCLDRVGAWRKVAGK